MLWYVDMVACRYGPILALKRRDGRDVIVLSTKQKQVMTFVSMIARGHRVLKENRCTVGLQDYNRRVGGGRGVANSNHM